MHCTLWQRVQGGGDNDETCEFSEKTPTAEGDEAGMLRRVALAMSRQSNTGSSTPGSAEQELTTTACNTSPTLVRPFCHNFFFLFVFY